MDRGREREMREVDREKEKKKVERQRERETYRDKDRQTTWIEIGKVTRDRQKERK